MILERGKKTVTRQEIEDEEKKNILNKDYKSMNTLGVSWRTSSTSPLPLESDVRTSAMDVMEYQNVFLEA